MKIRLKYDCEPIEVRRFYRGNKFAGYGIKGPNGKPIFYDKEDVAELREEDLLDSIQETKDAALALVDAVEKYVAPKPGDKYCSRTEILNAKDNLKKLLQ